MIKNKRVKKAVSEVIGTMILLGISISLFSVVHFMVFSYPFNPPPPSVNLIATLNESGIIKIKHNYGDPLDLETKIIISGADSASYTASTCLNDKNNDDHWGIGEYVEITPTFGPDIYGKYIVMIFDHTSNQMIMRTDLNV